MCRLMAYVGQPQLLADIVLWPDRSIIKQSYDARERKIDPTLPFHLGHGNLNGDGFGIGWFSPDERRERDPTPCVFTSITPAWNNENLSRLACKIVSPLVFAHVRAAYPGMPVSEQNCHPFQFSRYMWMHNGVVAGFAQIRRSLLETLSDCAYNAVASFHSDSAVSFALFLNHLPDIRAQLAPDVLIKAMQDTIATISAVQRRHGITSTSLLNYVVSDGTTLIATRFVSPESDGPASLYYAEGASFARTAPAANAPPPAAAAAAAAAASAAAPGCAPCAASANSSSVTQESSYELGLSAQGPAVVFVASEPITASASDWVAVPKNTALVVTREKGGFLNILRCPLRSQPQPQPSPSAGPSPPGASAAAARSAAPVNAAAPQQLQLQQPQSRFSSGGGAPAGPPFIDPQRDVCLCLEALSRGITAKSRAFLAHRPTGLGLTAMGSTSLPPGLDTLQEPPPSITSIVGPVTSFSRSSLGGLPAQLEAASGPLAAPPSASRACSLGQELPGAQPAGPDAHDFMRLVGHNGPILAMTVCSHTNRLYTSSVDCSLRVWSLRDNSCQHTLVGQRKPVTAMRLRAQGRLLLASSGRRIRVWDAIHFRCLQLIKMSDSCGTIRCLEVIGAQLAPAGPRPSPPPPAAAAGQAPQGAGAATDSGRSSLAGDDGASTSAATPRGRGRYSADGGGSLSLGLLEALTLQDLGMDAAASGGGVKEALSAAAPDSGAGSARGSGAGALSLLYVGCQDTTVKVFTLDEQELLAAAAAAEAAAAAAAALAAQAGAAAAAEASAQAPLAPPRVVQLAAAQAGGRAAAAAGASMTTPPPSPFVPSRAGSLRLASRTSVTGVCGPPALLPARIIATQEEPEQGLSDLAPLMVTAAEGGAHVGPVNCLALCGRYLCSGGGDATVRVWDAATLKLVGVLRGHRGSVLCLLSLGSSILLSGARDNTIRVWDLEMDMMCRRTLTGHKDDVTGLAALTLLPQPQHQHQHQQQQQRGPAAAAGGTVARTVSAAAWASTVIASSSADGTVRLWSTSWACLCILSLPAAASVPGALCGCLSADMAMAGYTDGEVRLWHIDDIHRAVLGACCAEAAGAATAALAGASAAEGPDGPAKGACGCLGAHSAGCEALQAALAHVQQYGAAGAVAAAGVLSSAAAAAAGGGGIQEALRLLSPGGGGSRAAEAAAAADGAAAADAAAAPPPQPATESSRQSGGGAESVQGPDGCGAAPLLPQAPPSASGSGAVVPIHIHGRRSPLTGTSMANMAALVAGGGAAGGCAQAATGAGAAAAGGVSPCGQLRVSPLALPLPGPALLGSYFCSTSDQQLEAALRDFVRIKTVSNNPQLRDDCHKGAKFVAKMLEGLGADVKVVQVYEDKNPVVIGRLGHNPDRPTVTFYGHYDVQPAAEPDWATNPFELNSVNEYLYGRGVSDNKGPILAFIFAVRELMNNCGGDCAGAAAAGGRLGRLPVNVAFIFEGEEENGSRGFSQAIMSNLRWFEGTQLIIISNTLWVGENVPCLTYGMRGMLSLTVQITGPERDLHSGNDGGVFSEPMVDLLRVMATLVGQGGKVQVPGFYDNVEPSLIELAWTSLEDSEEFSLEGYKAALGVPALTAPPHKRDLLVTRWCRPSLSVVDMRPGAPVAGAGQQSEQSTCYRFGPTRFSVIPKAAQGKVSVRFVPNQDADQLVACLRSHVEQSFSSLGSSNKIDLHVEARGKWWEVRQGSPWLAMAEAAIHKEWGVHPLYVREGGTMPVASYLERMLCAPAIMIPMGQSSDNCHLANERIRRTNLFKGKNVIRRLLEEIAHMGDPGASGAGGPAGAPPPPAAAGAGAGVPDGADADGGMGLGIATACAGLPE
ncbi:hypothetical protein PLESTB_000932700 [Pleodorina starrii]|uniref:Glutamine amidotransferase type-2 domain-containing protein n=1 Tax=Pleodorina starrii TaxID=330485 RepID=A0A9W6BN44_9CHLO|nr:hypothetical protein PLESTM_001552500 [Pleodorina starrii]GLC55028.1 hypothetical protein PLESTB_000932700 [Pleodorina starrii]GLC68406.1 hypothetical protein PLESTF_000688100 [Pleodorina starrii]